MRPDPHSYADTAQPQTRRISFDLHVDFELHALSGEIELHFREPGGGPLDLDTNHLRIAAVFSLVGAPLRFGLAKPQPSAGTRRVARSGLSPASPTLLPRNFPASNR